MGCSPSTHIFFGVYLGSEGSWHNDKDYTELPKELEDFDDMIAIAGGVHPPEGEFDSGKYGVYLDLRRPLIEACPIQLIQSGYQFSEQAIALKKTVIRGTGTTTRSPSPITIGS